MHRSPPQALHHTNGWVWFRLKPPREPIPPADNLLSTSSPPPRALVHHTSPSRQPRSTTAPPLSGTAQPDGGHNSTREPPGPATSAHQPPISASGHLL
ncbi:hypothetical protein Dimus_022896, partial [Dionaea muscipula]